MNNGANKFYVCLSQRLAGYLMLNGFVLLKFEKNIKDPYKNIFIFLNTTELMNAIQQYKMQKDMHKFQVLI